LGRGYEIFRGLGYVKLVHSFTSNTRNTKKWKKK
jgi:hypothetical protein